MKCPNCGAKMVRTPDKILTSEPPMYEYTCPKCKSISYQRTDVVDADEIESCIRSAELAVPDPWWEFRCKAAKDFIVGMLAHAHRYHPRDPKETDWHKAIVEEGIEIADELVKQLKEQK